MTDNLAETPLTIPGFGTAEIVAADAFVGPPTAPTPGVGASTCVAAGLNPNDLGHAYRAIGPAVDAGLAIDDEDPSLDRSFWIDLGTPEAHQQAERLRMCADAAARFEQAGRQEPTATPTPEEMA